MSWSRGALADSRGAASGSSGWRWVGYAAAAGTLYVTFRVARRVYAVLTYSDPAALIDHGCIPSEEDEWDHR
jgi:hypothetical protein